MSQTNHEYNIENKESVQSLVIGEHNPIINYFVYDRGRNPDTESIEGQETNNNNLPCPYREL